MMISYLALFWSFFTVDNFSHYSFSNNQEIICQWRRCYHAWLLSSIWRLLVIDPGRVAVDELDMGRLILYISIYYYLWRSWSWVVYDELGTTFSTCADVRPKMCFFCPLGKFIVWLLKKDLSKIWDNSFDNYMGALEDVMLPRLQKHTYLTQNIWTCE